MTAESIALVAASAFGVSVLATPVVAVSMTRLGIVDRPDGRRKLHGREVPLAGGLAVWAAVLAAVWGLPSAAGGPGLDAFSWRWFFVATGLICIVGVVDDVWQVRGRYKLLGQTVAAGILVGSGLLVRRIDLLGWDVELGALAVPVTMLWLLGATNAMNLIDGMDGLASTVGAVIAIALCAMAGLVGRDDEAVVAAALAGGLLGFLIYNFPPARVFLGDTGSMMIGLVLGVVAIRASLKGVATFAVAAPLAAWTLPFFDVGMAVLRRKLTGRSIYSTDRGHLHHRLGERGLTTRRSLLLVALLCSVTAAGAVAAVALRLQWLAPASTVAVAAFLVFGRLFGHSECALLARRMRSLAASFVPASLVGAGDAARQHSSRLQGSREWDQLWESLVGYAERLGLIEVQLDVSLPAVNEEFFASWKRPFPGDARPYKVEIPLQGDLGPVGWLRVGGLSPEGAVCDWVAGITAGLKGFETELAEFLAAPADDAPRPTTCAARPRMAAKELSAVEPVLVRAAYAGRD
jgi:UDP-GlcNAc:undecaprenyl-phosphate GlcNAc-1-phosphate transferase